MKRSILFLFTLWSLGHTQAQTPSFLPGKVTDETGRPLQGASVTSGAALTGGAEQKTITDTSGRFTIAFSAQSVLSVTHLGYVPFRAVPPFPDPLIIRMKRQPRELAAIDLVAGKPLIEQQFDRVVMNVNGDPRTGINAVDILRKMPGLAIVNSDDIRLEGKSVTVYIDGRPSKRSGADLVALLNSLSSAGISQVEAVYNPSARFDAQGSGGIVNIKTLKRTLPGYEGYLAVTGGHGWKYFSGNDLSGTINYRKNSDYLSASYDFGFGKQSQEIRTESFFNSTNRKLDTRDTYVSPYRGHDLRVGWDRNFGPKNVGGLLLTASSGWRENRIYAGIDQYTAAMPDSTIRSASSGPRTNQGVNLNGNIKWVIDSLTGHDFSIDADAGLFRSNSHTLLEKFYENGADLRFLEKLGQQSTTNSRIFSFKADDTRKFFKGNLDLGLKASQVLINTDFLAEHEESGGTFHQSGNDFRYRESILAAYASTKQVIGKLTLQAGLRTELTLTRGRSVTLDSIVSRRYLNGFPNLALGYRLPAGTLSFSASRRIGRPSYAYLNPFTVTRNPYSQSRGNPYLNPSFAVNYRLGYALKKVSAAISWSRVNDVITDLKLVDDQTRITTNVKSNLSENRNIGLSASYTDKLFGAAALSISAGTSQNRYRFLYLSANQEIRQVTAWISASNRITLPRTWWAEVFFYGQGRVTYGNEINLPFSSTGISGGKKVFGQKGSLSFTANDVFFSSITRSEANYANVNYQLLSRYDSRSFRLNLTWNFGRGKADGRSRNPGSTEEQRRNQ